MKSPTAQMPNVVCNSNKHPDKFNFMRQVLSYFTLSILVIVIGCKTNNMSGVYICDQSQKKTDTTINHGNTVEKFLDLTCTIEELDFKGNSTVVLKMENGPIVTSYVVDKDYIRVKGSGADMLFKIKDNEEENSLDYMLIY